MEFEWEVTSVVAPKLDAKFKFGCRIDLGEGITKVEFEVEVEVEMEVEVRVDMTTDGPMVDLDRR